MTNSPEVRMSEVMLHDKGESLLKTAKLPEIKRKILLSIARQENLFISIR